MQSEPNALDRVITLADGRKIGYRVYGDLDGRPVLALHGTPGSRFKYSGSDAVAKAVGLRLISIDRWGYGLSSPHGRPTLVEFGADMVEFADQLKLDRVAITGISGGGPFAVAASVALGSRTTALGLVSPVGLIHGPAGRAKLGAFHTLSFRALPQVPGAIPAVFNMYRAILVVAPHLAMSLAVSRSAVDQRAMRRPDTHARLIETFAAGLSSGVKGPQTDMGLFAKPWGFDPARVVAPVKIWIGLEDRNVPLGAVRALATAMPGAQLTELPGEGHLWVAQNSDQVMNWLAAAMSEPACRVQ